MMQQYFFSAVVPAPVVQSWFSTVHVGVVVVAELEVAAAGARLARRGAAPRGVAAVARLVLARGVALEALARDRELGRPAPRAVARVAGVAVVDAEGALGDAARVGVEPVAAHLGGCRRRSCSWSRRRSSSPSSARPSARPSGRPSARPRAWTWARTTASARASAPPRWSARPWWAWAWAGRRPPCS